MKTGIWITILGILVVVIGGAMYVTKFQDTIGAIGAILGFILLVVGVAWWTMKDRTAPGPAQPAKTP
jgi:amino acid transporter